MLRCQELNEPSPTSCIKKKLKTTAKQRGFNERLLQKANIEIYL